MRALFYRDAMVEDDDSVGVDDGLEEVGNDDAGAALGDAVERVLDRLLGAAERYGFNIWSSPNQFYRLCISMNFRTHARRQKGERDHLRFDCR